MKQNIEKLIKDKKYSKIKEILNKMNEYDIANIFEDLPQNEMAKLFRLLNKDIAADVFSYLETDTEAMIISSLSDNEAVSIINDMSADDATDLMDEMPANVVSKLLSKVDVETRRDINTLLKYPDNSAGSIMTVEYLDFKEYITIKDAIIIGLFQMVTIIPGISRSGTVLVACLLCHLKRDTALKYTFILYFPVSVATMLLGIGDLANTQELNTLLVPYLLGMVAAGVVTYFSYKWLSNWVKQGKLWKFSIYCLLLAIFIFIYFR